MARREVTMCLSRVEEIIANPSSVIQDGAKQFTGSKGIYFETYPLDGSSYGNREVPLDKWLTATEKDVTASDSQSYKSGFHIYEEKTPKDRRRRVYFRYVTAIGAQDGKNVLIAREMYVPSNENDWPPMANKTSPDG